MSGKKSVVFLVTEKKIKCNNHIIHYFFLIVVPATKSNTACSENRKQGLSLAWWERMRRGIKVSQRKKHSR